MCHIWTPLLSKFKTKIPLNSILSRCADFTATSGILGRIPKTKSLYECHSFTGRGVMQSYGAAIAITELIINGKFETLQARCLSRDRFLGGNESELLPEGLHI